MDRNFLSDEYVVAASRDFVCIRLVTYENKDGKVSKEELPERKQGILERADSNKDGALDKT